MILAHEQVVQNDNYLSLKVQMVEVKMNVPIYSLIST